MIESYDTFSGGLTLVGQLQNEIEFSEGLNYLLWVLTISSVESIRNLTKFAGFHKAWSDNICVSLCLRIEYNQTIVYSNFERIICFSEKFETLWWMKMRHSGKCVKFWLTQVLPTLTPSNRAVISSIMAKKGLQTLWVYSAKTASIWYTAHQCLL